MTIGDLWLMLWMHWKFLCYQLLSIGEEAIYNNADITTWLQPKENPFLRKLSIEL